MTDIKIDTSRLDSEAVKDKQEESIHINLVTKGGQSFRHPVLKSAQEVIYDIFYKVLNPEQKEKLISYFVEKKEEVDFERFAIEVQSYIEVGAISTQNLNDALQKSVE